jgi:hypothetical protein
VKLISSDLPKERDEVRKGVVIELERFGRLDDKRIAEALSELSLKDSIVRRALLGELAMAESISKHYNGMLNGIIKGEFEGTEKAYAMYLLGREKGAAHLASEFGLTRSSVKETNEKIALFLVQVVDFERGRTSYLDVKSLFKSGDHGIDFVELAELGRVIREHGRDSRVTMMIPQIVARLEEIEPHMLNRNGSRPHHDTHELFTAFRSLVDRSVNGHNVAISGDLQGLVRRPDEPRRTRVR